MKSKRVIEAYLRQGVFDCCEDSRTYGQRGGLTAALNLTPAQRRARARNAARARWERVRAQRAQVAPDVCPCCGRPR